MFATACALGSVFVDRADVRWISLDHHSATPSQAVHAIEARVFRLALKQWLTGQIARLRIPPAKPPRDAQGLSQA
jgi:hypothetical protein